VSYPGPPDFPFPSGHGESSRYEEDLTDSADDGVESAYMRDNCKHGYSFLCVVLFSRMYETSRLKIHKNTCNQDHRIRAGNWLLFHHYILLLLHRFEQIATLRM
jgi:hypothetical protein